MQINKIINKARLEIILYKTSRVSIHKRREEKRREDSHLLLPILLEL
jgi:hypothetical protein